MHPYSITYSVLNIHRQRSEHQQLDRQLSHLVQSMDGVQVHDGHVCLLYLHGILLYLYDLLSSMEACF